MLAPIMMEEIPNRTDDDTTNHTHSMKRSGRILYLPIASSGPRESKERKKEKIKKERKKAHPIHDLEPRFAFCVTTIRFQPVSSFGKEERKWKEQSAVKLNIILPSSHSPINGARHVMNSRVLGFDTTDRLGLPV